MMDDSKHEISSHVEPNATLLDSPDTFFYYFDTKFKITRKHATSVAEHLRVFFDLCISRDGTFQQNFQIYMAQPDDRRKWIERLRKFTESFVKITQNLTSSSDADVENAFAAMTNASLVYLYTYIANADAIGVDTFDRTEISDFLRQCSTCIKPTKNTVILKCVKPLQTLVESPTKSAETTKNIKNMGKYVHFVSENIFN